MTFDQWCADVRQRFENQFGYAPSKAPSLIELTDRIQERMMRCGIETRWFQIDHQDYDQLAILAHHTLLLDDLKANRSNSYHRYG